MQSNVLASVFFNYSRSSRFGTKTAETRNNSNAINQDTNSEPYDLWSHLKKTLSVRF